MSYPDIPDVSEHQGKINWDAIKTIPGAIIRIGYGDDLKGQDDLYALYNMRECRRLGIPFAVYIYSYAKTKGQVKSEIAHTKRVCEGFDPISYWYDLEKREYAPIWKEAARLWAEAFGDKAGVYSWQWAFEKHVDKGRRWICAYGTNNGRKQTAYKPDIECDGWQYTSRKTLPGISGYVDMSEWYADFGGAKPAVIKQGRKIVTKKEVAALIMRHLCTHDRHGYTQDMSGRQGTGEEVIDIYGVKYTIRGGDRDCSSAVLSAYRAAGIYCGNASYTGNMKQEMVASGNFIFRSMKFIAQMADSYLVHDEKKGRCHTAMCLSAEPDVLMEFSINEKGGTLGGKVGDQKQKGEYDEAYGRGESHLAAYYDYPGGGWDGILQCICDEDAFIIEADGTITFPEKKETVKKAEDTPFPDMSDADLAVEAIFDVHGSGSARMDALGTRYDNVQKIVTALWASPADRTEAEKAYLKRFGHGKLI